MVWIDTHCHLDNPLLSTNIDSVLKESLDHGVEVLVMPAVNRKSLDDVIKIAQQYPQCLFALGYHPLFIDNYKEGDIDILSNYLNEHDAVAVGEIGLDFFTRRDNLVDQENLFVDQLKLAKSFDLPVIVHARGAIDRILKHLRSMKIKGGIIHAFNGSFQQAYQLIELNFKLGFGGAMTYQRATHLRKLAEQLPIESIVLETDAPDMPPAWLQNDVYNQPKELSKIGQFFCELRGLEPVKLAEIIRGNAIKALPKLVKLYT